MRIIPYMYIPFGTLIEEVEDDISKMHQENNNYQNEIDKLLLSMLQGLNNDSYFIVRYIQLLEEKIV